MIYNLKNCAPPSVPLSIKGSKMIQIPKRLLILLVSCSVFDLLPHAYAQNVREVDIYKSLVTMLGTDDSGTGGKAAQLCETAPALCCGSGKGGRSDLDSGILYIRDTEDSYVRVSFKLNQAGSCIGPSFVTIQIRIDNQTCTLKTDGYQIEFSNSGQALLASSFRAIIDNAVRQAINSTQGFRCAQIMQ